MKRICWFAITFALLLDLTYCGLISEEDSGSIEIPARFVKQRGRTNGIPKESARNENISLLKFIGNVLNTAQHRCRMAVERAKKKYGLSKTITKDAERLLEEAIKIKL